MKKLLAIPLLAVMLFNLLGYQRIFRQLEQRAQRQMIARVDQHRYDQGNLIEVRIPLHLPYISDNQDFERYDGSVIIDGQSYNYVERKLENDTLVLHCIQNRQADQIKLAFSAFNKSLNESSSPQQDQKCNVLLLLRSLVTGDCKSKEQFLFNGGHFIVLQSTYQQPSEAPIKDGFAQNSERPPDAI